MSDEKKIIPMVPRYSATEQRGSGGRVVAPRNISYREYYDRWGYLPPGFEIELPSGEKIIGGCAKWRAHADKMGYPKEPPPWATRQEKDDWQRFLDSKYRPWMNSDAPITGPLYEDDFE